VSRGEKLELAAYICFVIALVFFCAVFVHLLLDHHDPNVPTHAVIQEVWP
jgi:hypothetical protein